MSVLERNEIGHWEMDTVVGSRTKGVCLLVLTERLSRKEIILKLKDKTSQSVIKSLQYLKKQMSRKALNQFKTITTDNGSEFMNAEAIETELGVKCFMHTATALGKEEVMRIIING